MVNQKLQLECYTAQHSFTNCVHYIDGGWNGGNFVQSDWERLAANIEAGKISRVITKDMSRIDRGHFQTGFYTESLFREMTKLKVPLIMWASKSKRHNTAALTPAPIIIGAVLWSPIFLENRSI